MAKRTYSHRNVARRISQSREKLAEHKRRVINEMENYLKTGSSLEDLLRDLSKLPESIFVRFDKYLIRIDKNGFSISPENNEIKQKLNYVMLNLPPVPRSFENFYNTYLKLKNERDKINLIRSYFSQIPENVEYCISLGDSFIKFKKKGNEIYYKRIHKRFPKSKKYDKKIVYQILSYANAHNH